MDLVALWLGRSILFLAALALVMGLAWVIIDELGKELFRRMLRLYHLSSIGYWLHHYEKQGRKCFLDPKLDERAGGTWQARL